MKASKKETKRIRKALTLQMILVKEMTKVLLYGVN